LGLVRGTHLWYGLVWELFFRFPLLLPWPVLRAAPQATALPPVGGVKDIVLVLIKKMTNFYMLPLTSVMSPLPAVTSCIKQLPRKQT